MTKERIPDDYDEFQDIGSSDTSVLPTSLPKGRSGASSRQDLTAMDMISEVSRTSPDLHSGLRNKREPPRTDPPLRDGYQDDRQRTSQDEPWTSVENTFVSPRQTAVESQFVDVGRRNSSISEEKTASDSSCGSRVLSVPSQDATMTTTTVTEAISFLAHVFGENSISRMASYEREAAQAKKECIELRQKLEEAVSRGEELERKAEGRINELSIQIREEKKQLTDAQARAGQLKNELQDASDLVTSLSKERADLEQEIEYMQRKVQEDLLAAIARGFGTTSSLYEVLSGLLPEDLSLAGNCCLYVLPTIRPPAGTPGGINIQYLIALGRRFLENVNNLNIAQRPGLLNAVAGHFSQFDSRYIFHNVEGHQFNGDRHEGRPIRPAQRIRRMESFLVMNSANVVVTKAVVVL